MKLYVLKTTDPYYNLAFEEYLFNNTREDVMILWQNSPCVVIGKNQNVYSEVDVELAKAKGINIVRRITGGGAVYHDLGNINYSFISPFGGGSIDFAHFSAPIIGALEKLSIDCELSGRNDIVIGGKKISGNAQHNSFGKTLHHGTILYDADFETMQSVLTVNRDKFKSKSVKSVAARVANLKEFCDLGNASNFINYLADYIKNEYSAEIAEQNDCEEIELLTARNRSDNWIYPACGIGAEYSYSKRERFEFGDVEIFLKLKNDIIIGCEIFGDFFELLPVNRLCELLVGKSLSSLVAGELDINVSDFIFNMRQEDFIKLLSNN